LATHISKTKAKAKNLAKKFRKKGFFASIYKRKKGWGVSVTRKKK